MKHADRLGVTRISGNACVITLESPAQNLTNRNPKAIISQFLRHHEITDHVSRIYEYVILEKKKKG
jgi:hypothetical protein